jgi:hypothetical protein
MKSVPNLIFYIHYCFWNFSQFLAIYFERFSSGVILIRKTLRSGSHLSDDVVCAGPTWQRTIAAWLPRAAPHPCIKCAVRTARRRPDSPRRSDRATFRPHRRRCLNRLASPRSILITPSPLSESRRCPAVRRRRELRPR